MTTFHMRERMRERAAVFEVTDPEPAPGWTMPAPRRGRTDNEVARDTAPSLLLSDKQVDQALRAIDEWKRPPLFAARRIPSRAIAIALVISVCMVIFVLKTS